MNLERNNQCSTKKLGYHRIDLIQSPSIRYSCKLGFWRSIIQQSYQRNIKNRNSNLGIYSKLSWRDKFIQLVLYTYFILGK